MDVSASVLANLFNSAHGARYRSYLRTTLLWAAAALVVSTACDGSERDYSEGTGGAAGTGATTGGATATAGTTATGGMSSTGGVSATGGGATTAGATNQGGAGASGGTPTSMGGASSTGGAPSTGGDGSGGSSVGGEAGDGSQGGAAGAAGADPGGAGGEAGAGGAGPDLSCLGEPLPPAAEVITISGSVRSTGALPGVLVEMLPTSGGPALDSVTTASDGTFSVSAPTGGSPLSIFLRSSLQGYWDTYTYPPKPLTEGVTGQFLTQGTQAHVDAYAAAAKTTQEAGKGVLSLYVLDCSLQPIVGAKVLLNPAAAVYYTLGGVPRPSETATLADGIALAFNLSPGDVLVDATIDGQSLSEHTVKIHADSATVTVVVP